jgi:hypothetical protein
MLLLLVLCLLSIKISSQPKPKTVELTTFDRNAEKLLPNYIGNDPISIAEDFMGRLKISIKDEFETTAEYNTRSQKLWTLPLKNGKQTSSLFTFNAVPFDTFFSYDADKEIVTVKTGLRPLNTNLCDSYFKLKQIKPNIPSELEENCYGMPLFYKVGDSRLYDATNAFGAKVRVTQNDEYMIWAVFTQKSIQPTANNYFYFQMKQTPLQAKQLKSDIGTLVIGKMDLLKPFRFDIKITKPTFENPKESTGVYMMFSFTTEELWIYQKSTGRILKKFDANSMRFLPPYGD